MNSLLHKLSSLPPIPTATPYTDSSLPYNTHTPSCSSGGTDWNASSDNYTACLETPN